MKIDKAAENRLEGMDYALRQIEKIGTEEFRKELNTRRRTGIAVNLSPKELNDCSEKIKAMCLDTVLTMSVLVLHDEFGFGKKRIRQFFDRFTLKSSCLEGGFASWQDYMDIVKNELGFKITIRMND